MISYNLTDQGHYINRKPRPVNYGGGPRPANPIAARHLPTRQGVIAGSCIALMVQVVSLARWFTGHTPHSGHTRTHP